MIAAASGVGVARYALGVAALLVIGGSLALAAVALRRRLLGDWTGAPARLAESVIALALLTAILEAVGTIGLFQLGPVVGVTALTSLGVARAAGMPGRDHSRQAVVPHGRAGLLVALLAAAAVLAEWAVPTFQSYDVGIRTFDSLWYHLPWAASFAQTGQVTGLRFTDVEYLTAFYPATAELLHGLGIVLFARDTLSPALNLLWLGLALLAAWCVGRPRGLGPATLTGAALALGTPMMTFSQAGSAANDVLGVFLLLAAVALLVNAEGAKGPGAWPERAPLALAAVAAGLAIAVKLSLLAPVAALTVGVLALAPAGRRRAGAALWLGPLILAGGFWYVRNLIAVGNPLPWVSIPGLSTPAAPLQAHTAFSVAHYIVNGRILHRFFEPGLTSGLGPWWPAIVVAAVLGPLLCVLAPGGRQRSTRVLGLVAVAALLGYLVTPESAAGPSGQPLGFAFNLRYSAPALTLALTVLPLAPFLGGARRRVIVLGALAVLMVATLAQTRLWPSSDLAGAVALGAALALAAALARTLRGRRRPRTRLVAGLLVLGLLAPLSAAAAGGYLLQRHYLRGRYAYQPGVSSLSGVWAFFRHVHDARVGIVGTFGGFFSYPLYGLDDSDHVQYVAGHGPHGSFTAIGTCPRWRATVNAGHYRDLVTTPSRDPWHPRALGPSLEGAWTASDPAARAVYTHRAAGQTITIYELHGALNPATCHPRPRTG